MKIVKEFSYSGNTITYKVFDGATQLSLFTTSETTLESLFNVMRQLTDKFCWGGFNKATVYSLFDINNGAENALAVDLTLTGSSLNFNKSLSNVVEEFDFIITKYLSDNKFNILLKNDCSQDIEF